MHARAAPGAPSPLELAQLRRGTAAEGEVVRAVLEASEPWSPSSHCLWPQMERSRAAELLRLGQLLSLQPFFAGEEQVRIVHHMVHCMVHYMVHYMVNYMMHCIVHYIVHCRLHYMVHYIKLQPLFASAYVTLRVSTLVLYVSH